MIEQEAEEEYDKLQNGNEFFEDDEKGKEVIMEESEESDDSTQEMDS